MGTYLFGTAVEVIQPPSGNIWLKDTSVNVKKLGPMWGGQPMKEKSKNILIIYLI